MASALEPLAPGVAADASRGALGGGSAALSPEHRARWRAALGKAGRLLANDDRDRETERLVVDADRCWLDGRQLEDESAWWHAIRSDALDRIDGGFALAWRERDGSLGLARDAAGERRLFYTIHRGELHFASRLHDLLASGDMQLRLHSPSLVAYLCCAYIPGADTGLEGVRELLPGEVLRFRRGAPTASDAWCPPGEEAVPKPEDEARDELRALLEGALRRRLEPGCPIGASLSGGLDSSLVVALARHLHDAPVLTYSLCFGAPHRDELAWSALLARHCDTRHHVVEMPADAILAHLDATLAHLSKPVGDPLTVPNALLFREASRDVDALLNGEGGDPCFGGPKNLPMLIAALQGDPGGGATSLVRSYLRAYGKCFDELDELLEPECRDALVDEPVERAFEPYLADRDRGSLVNQLMWLNTRCKGVHHILAKVDELGSALGVRARSPLFDREIVALATRLPAPYKLRGSIEKYLLKRAVEDLLPRAILDRPKSGMLVPVEDWFRGPLRAAARERLLDGLAPRRIVRRSYLESLLAGRRRGLHPRRGAKLWLLVSLESWLRGLEASAGRRLS